MARNRRYTSQQQQEKISRAQCQEFFSQYGWVVGDITPDLGEDFLVQIYDDGKSTGLGFYLQLKSVQDITQCILDTGEISYQFEVKDLEHWENTNPAVILVIWDIQSKQGWWVSMNEVIESLNRQKKNWRNQANANIHIPQRNELNEKNLPRIRRFLADLFLQTISKTKEITIHTRFEFPNTTEGQEIFGNLRRHITKGDMIIIDGEYIKELRLSDWIERLYGKIDPSCVRLTIGSVASTARPAKITYISSLGEESIPYVELQIVKKGTEETTISNENQKNAFIKLKIVINTAQHQFELTMSSFFPNLTWDNALIMLRIQHIFSTSGKIKITFYDNNEVIDFSVEKAVFPPMKERIIGFVELICKVQKAFEIQFAFSENIKFTHLDFMAAEKLLDISNCGRYEHANMTSSIKASKPDIQKLIEIYDENTPVVVVSEEEDSYVNILSTKVILGPVHRTIRGYWREPRSEVNAWLAHAKDEDTLDVQLVQIDLVEVYERWISKGEAMGQLPHSP